MTTIFDEIISTFENEDIKEFYITKVIPEYPPYWEHVPASSSGRFHSAISLGEGGLKRHTFALVRLMNYMFEVESVANNFTSRERDILRIAGLFHDSQKSGTQEDYEQNPQTKFDHPLRAAKIIYNIDTDLITPEEKTMLCKCIASHMGQFNTSKREPDIVLPKPQTKYEIIVHLCDYIVSRKDVELKFDKKDLPEPEPLPDINTWAFPYGKYQGKTIPEVAAENPGYIHWAKTNMEREPARSLLATFEIPKKESAEDKS